MSWQRNGGFIVVWFLYIVFQSRAWHCNKRNKYISSRNVLPVTPTRRAFKALRCLRVQLSENDYELSPCYKNLVKIWSPTHTRLTRGPACTFFSPSLSAKRVHLIKICNLKCRENPLELIKKNRVVTVRPQSWYFLILFLLCKTWDTYTSISHQLFLFPFFLNYILFAWK